MSSVNVISHPTVRSVARPKFHSLRGSADQVCAISQKLFLETRPRSIHPARCSNPQSTAAKMPAPRGTPAFATLVEGTQQVLTLRKLSHSAPNLFNSNSDGSELRSLQHSNLNSNTNSNFHFQISENASSGCLSISDTLTILLPEPLCMPFYACFLCLFSHLSLLQVATFKQNDYSCPYRFPYNALSLCFHLVQ